jgi:hypothetical protein
MEKKEFNLGIKKIKELEFFINEDIALDDNKANVRFDVTVNLNPDEKVIEMILTIHFSEMKNGENIMRIKTSNVFSMLELVDLIDAEKKQFTIPDDIMITILSLSISHTRALHAKNILGTKFSELYVPLVNPAQLFKQLFKKQ